jgi:hypothetical protein
MDTSQKTSSLYKPRGADLIPFGTLGYFRARNRWRAYEVVLTEFKNSGLTKADLARRLGKRPEVISRLLGAPGNWGLDTVSDLLFAISGAEPVYNRAYPLEIAARNDNRPEWLDDDNYEWVTDSQIVPKQVASAQADKQTLAAGLPVTLRQQDEDSRNSRGSMHSASYSGLAVAEH